jgi:hypothetical protein
MPAMKQGAEPEDPRPGNGHPTHFSFRPGDDAPRAIHAKRSIKAATSLGLSIVAFPAVLAFFIGPLLSIAAIVLSVLANREISRSKGRLTGKGLAGTALAFGIAGLLFAIWFAVVVVAGLGVTSNRWSRI